MSEFKNLTLDVADEIAVLAISRPAALNALNSETLDELNVALTEIEARDDVKVVILTGGPDKKGNEFKSFVAGADIAEMVNFTAPQARAFGIKAAEPFFTSLDSVAISICDKTSILKRYRYFLAEVKNNGINSKDELLDFIRQEDFLFRTFLAHLYEMDKEPLADITKDTETICRDIFISARNGNIAAKDVVVYMSMRTVRRLLQNSVECVNNINSLEMKTKAQGNAYIWMIIQPFISIDQFSLATMTPLERSKFNYIITNLPKSKRFAQVFDIKQRELNYLLPQQLLKIYVLSL